MNTISRVNIKERNRKKNPPGRADLITLTLRWRVSMIINNSTTHQAPTQISTESLAVKIEFQLARSGQ